MRFIIVSVAFHAALAVIMPHYPGRDAAPESGTVNVEIYAVSKAGDSAGYNKAAHGHPRRTKSSGSTFPVAPAVGPHEVPVRKEISAPEVPSARAAMADLEHLRYVVPNSGNAQNPKPSEATLPVSYGTASDTTGHDPADGTGYGTAGDTEGAYGLAGSGVGGGDAGHYRGFGEGGGPGIVRLVKPVYPALARKLSKNGSVVLAISIDEDGSLEGVTIEKPAGYGFDEAAVDAVRKSDFAPAKVDGSPVACIAKLTVRFELDGNGL